MYYSNVSSGEPNTDHESTSGRVPYGTMENRRPVPDRAIVREFCLQGPPGPSPGRRNSSPVRPDSGLASNITMLYQH